MATLQEFYSQAVPLLVEPTDLTEKQALGLINNFLPSGENFGGEEVDLNTDEGQMEIMERRIPAFLEAYEMGGAIVDEDGNVQEIDQAPGLLNTNVSSKPKTPGTITTEGMNDSYR